VIGIEGVTPLGKAGEGKGGDGKGGEGREPAGTGGDGLTALTLSRRGKAEEHLWSEDMPM